MGFTFSRGEFQVWSPGNTSSFLFLDNLKFWERTCSNISGICQTESGHVEITPRLIDEFIADVGAQSYFNNDTINRLARETFVLLLALRFAAGDDPPTTDNIPLPKDWVQEAYELHSRFQKYYKR